jgi:hypothetical protein
MQPSEHGESLKSRILSLFDVVHQETKIDPSYFPSQRLAVFRGNAVIYGDRCFDIIYVQSLGISHCLRLKRGSSLGSFVEV